MNEAERRLIDVASAQRQVFTRAQALDAGISPSGLSRRTASGLFVPVGPRTLTFAGVTLDWFGRLKAGLLDLGPGALVTAEAAAAVLGLDGFKPGPLVYLVTRDKRNRTTNGEVLSTNQIGPLDRARCEDMDVTSGTRTVVELLGRVERGQVGDALDSGTRKRITAPPVVWRRLEELGRKGRNGVADFDALMREAVVESRLERRFMELIGGTHLPRPATQRVYRSDGRHVARVDFDFAPRPVVSRHELVTDRAGIRHDP